MIFSRFALLSPLKPRFSREPLANWNRVQSGDWFYGLGAPEKARKEIEIYLTD